jgi:molecular chaperone GrpE
MPETYNIFKKQIEFMGKEQELYKKLKKETDILKKVNDDNHQKLVMMVSRIQASEKETESVKNRLTLQIEKERNFAIQKFAENALEILDNFDRCISVLDEKNEEHQQILKSDFFEGVKMTYNSTKNIFKRNKIQEMEGLVGTVADFDKHEAIFVTAYPGKQDNEIVIVSQKGYTIGERVLRTAKVGVVKNN